MTAQSNAQLISRIGRELGFGRVGFTPVGPVERHALYRDWLKRGHGAEMHYLAERSDERSDVRSLLPTARTVVTVALSYAPPDVPIENLSRIVGKVARYARGNDYHVVIKRKLTELGRRIETELDCKIAMRACVDTAPILEREAAHSSGIGFIAKNTMLIAPGLGSYVLLGELLIDLECTPGTPAEPRCGECRACLDACPTGAFVDAYELDARRCISYLTIELVGPIPRDLRPLIGNHIFGCDICQEVCPYNARAPEGAPELTSRGYSEPELTRLLGLGAAQFRKWQRGSARRRLHRPQLLRNVAVALGNVGTAAELPGLAHALNEKSSLVRQHVVWAIGQIGQRDKSELAYDILVEHQVGEHDAEVRREIELTLLEELS